MDLDKLVKQNWTNEASGYAQNVCDELNSNFAKKWLNVISPHLSADTQSNILDVGTGPGFFPVVLSKAGHKVTGIDCTQAMLVEAKKTLRKYGTNAELLLATADELPFADESFDCVISRNVVWTLENPEKSYLEWLRVLKPGGKIIIFDANWNYHYFNDDLKKKHEENTRKFQETFNKSSHILDEDGEFFRKQMPLCKVKRPAWDLNFFLQMQVSKIICDLKIHDKVWNEERKIAFGATPLFMFVIEK